MKLIYLAPIPFPIAKSDAVQVAHTVHEFARRELTVDLRVKSLRAENADEAMKFYGLEPMKNLRLGRLSPRREDRLNHWHGSSFQWGLYKLAYKELARTREPTLFYVFGGEKALYTVPRLKRAVRLFRGKVVFETHDSQYRSMPDRLRHERGVTDDREIQSETERIRRMERRALEAADGVVLVSDRLREQFVRDYALGTPSAIAYAASLVRRIAPDQIAEKDLDLVFAGQFYEYNGVEILIQALVRLPGVRLTLAGGANEEERERVLSLAERLCVRDRIDYRGLLPLPEVQALLRRAKIAAVPLRKGIYYRVDEFCFPTKLSEAMASAACPVVADLPSMRALLSEDENAVFFEANNPESLAEAVGGLLADAPRRERIAARALADSKRYTFNARVSNILKLFNQLFI